MNVDHDNLQTLTVSTIPTIGILWRMPRLAAFTSQQPDIEVRVVSDICTVDMHADMVSSLREVRVTITC